MRNEDKQLLGFVAIALAGLLTIYLTAMPAKKTSPVADEPLVTADASMIANIEPAAGDVAPGGVGSAPENATTAPDATVPEKGEPYSVVQIFATEQECKDATSAACHFVKCEDAAAVSADNEAEEGAVENACEATEKTGWRPVVPAPDKTAIPDVIAPPADLTDE